MSDKTCLAEDFVKSFKEMRQIGISFYETVVAACRDYQISEEGCFDEIVFPDDSRAVFANEEFIVKR